MGSFSFEFMAAAGRGLQAESQTLPLGAGRAQHPLRRCGGAAWFIFAGCWALCRRTRGASSGCDGMMRSARCAGLMIFRPYRPAQAAASSRSETLEKSLNPLGCLRAGVSRNPQPCSVSGPRMGQGFAFSATSVLMISAGQRSGGAGVPPACARVENAWFAAPCEFHCPPPSQPAPLQPAA